MSMRILRRLIQYVPRSLGKGGGLLLYKILTKTQIFDCFTATLGVTTEIAVQEKPNNQHEPVSGLEKMVCYRTQSEFWQCSPP